MKSKWLRRTVLILAIVAVLAAFFFLGAKIWVTQRFVNIVANAEEDHYPFGDQINHLIKPVQALDKVEGRAVDIYYAQVTVPDEPIEFARVFGDNWVYLKTASFGWSVSEIARCNPDRMKERLGQDIYEDSYRPADHFQSLRNLTAQLGYSPQQVPYLIEVQRCSRNWWRYFVGGQPRLGFGEAFWMSHDELVRYSMTLMISSAETHIPTKMLKGRFVSASISVRNGNAVGNIWSNDHKWRAEYRIKSATRNTEELSISILSSFRFTEIDATNPSNLRDQIADRLKTQGLNVIEKDTPEADETPPLLPE